MTDRQNISTGTPWEEIVGYSRAVRVGNMVFVTGTLGADDEGNIIGINDPYAQTVAAIKKIERALLEAGATLEYVVRTRMFVTDIDAWEAIGKAHKEYFGTIRPATTLVEVSRLVAPDGIIEIEADAVIQTKQA